jgi:hypothetical protein
LRGSGDQHRAVRDDDGTDMSPGAATPCQEGDSRNQPHQDDDGRTGGSAECVAGEEIGQPGTVSNPDDQAERAAFLGDGAYSGGQPADLGYPTA